jgi:dihydropteroate synthase
VATSFQWDTTRTLIMGVLNVTPDSFSDGGRYFNPEKAVEHGLLLVREGADWIDVGGESTRRGSESVPAEEELRRVLPVIRSLRRKLPSIPISIDTTKTLVAEKAVEAGASVLNDISGLRFDPGMAGVARRYRTPLVLMHLRGRFETMHTMPFVSDIWRSLQSGLAWSLERALTAGVRRSQLILDPGLGFGKSRLQNYEVISGLQKLERFGLPVLVGTSRKSFIQAVVAGGGLDGTGSKSSRRKIGPKAYWPMFENSKAQQAPALRVGDAAAVVASILGGAHIVRVHDVAGILPAVRIADALLAAGRLAKRRG